jgi:toxin ParE1/3/4
MARLIWTGPGLTDLDEIAEYIALDNISAAKKLVQKVFQKLERLERHPLSDRKPPELKKTSYRKVIVDPCRIFFRIDKKDIYILYVMRVESQLRKYLLDERGEMTKRSKR